jgi:type I restriction enzyme S subunit
MPRFQKYKLGELYNVASGLSKPREEFGFGYPFVTFKDVFYNYFLPDKLSELANTTEKEIKSCSVKKGDIFLTRTSETMDELGMSSVALKDYPNATFNGFTKRLRLKEDIDIKIDPIYIGYYFRTNEIRNQIDMHASMTTRASLNSRAINSIEISIPDTEYQIPIGRVLKRLDDKIELNCRTNHTLEQIAQTLFKKYFVDDIDPENLPEGWRKAPISSVARRIQYGFTQSASVKEIGPKFLRITDIQQGKIDWDEVPYCEANIYDFEKYKIVNHDIFIARTGASTGENVHILNPPKAVFASYLIRVQFENPMLATYVGKFLRQKEYFDYISSILGGSAQPNANAQELTGIEIIIPADDALKKYFLAVDLINRKKENNEKGNRTLSKLRDSLLPKLMSGEIEVSVAKKEFAE